GDPATYIYGGFTVASDGTISGTTGALTASGNTIDFDVSKLAAVTVYATDLQTAAGWQQAVHLSRVVPFRQDNNAKDTVYLPAGTFVVQAVSPGADNAHYGPFTVAADASGSLVVTGADGAAYITDASGVPAATGDTIHFDENKLAAVTVFRSDLQTAAG